MRPQLLLLALCCAASSYPVLAIDSAFPNATSYFVSPSLGKPFASGTLAASVQTIAQALALISPFALSGVAPATVFPLHGTYNGTGNAGLTAPSGRNLTLQATDADGKPTKARSCAPFRAR